MMVQALRKLRTVMKYGRTPAGIFLESLFPGEELKGLRAALCMIAPIKRIPAIGLLLFIGFALRGRAFLPEGGAIKAGEAFAAAAARHGAEIRYGAKVAGIRVREGRVLGVTLENGEQIDAGIVVSAADARQTLFRLLDPSRVPAGFKRKLDTTPVSDAFFLVSLVTDIDPAILGLDRVDTFISTTADIEEMLAPDDPEHSFFSIQFPEFRDPTARADRFGIQLVAPATFEFQEHWATGPGYGRTDEYRKLKEAFADALIRRVEAYFPGLSRHIVARDIATPITMHRYTLNERGAAVGWSYTSRRSWKQRVPFLKGLYQAGHWVGPSGIYNAASSGRNAAELILKDR
jgi:phytoene dehydrogenase-like protein